jgi:hypothetical protein
MSSASGISKTEIVVVVNENGLVDEAYWWDKRVKLQRTDYKDPSNGVITDDGSIESLTRSADVVTDPPPTSPDPKLSAHINENGEVVGVYHYNGDPFDTSDPLKPTKKDYGFPTSPLMNSLKDGATLESLARTPDLEVGDVGRLRPTLSNGEKA